MGPMVFDSRWLVMTCLYHINFSQIFPSFHLHHCRCRSDLHHRPHSGSVCRTPRGDDRPAPRGVLMPIKIGRTSAKHKLPILHGGKLRFSNLENCFKKVRCGLAERNCRVLSFCLRAPDVATGFCTGLPTPTKSTNNVHSVIGVKKRQLSTGFLDFGALFVWQLQCWQRGDVFYIYSIYLWIFSN